MNASLAINKLTERRTGPFSLTLLLADFSQRTAVKGEALMAQNKSKNYIFYLTEGVVKNLTYHSEKGKEVVNGYHTQGELMNLVVWSNSEINVPTLKAISSKVVFKAIPSDKFRELVWQNQGLNQLVLSALADKLVKSQERLQRLLLSKSHQRVIQFLVDYTLELGQKVGYEHVIKKPFTHEEMGNLSDTSRQTVTTVLNELRAKKLIHFTRRYILIRDLELLILEAKIER